VVLVAIEVGQRHTGRVTEVEPVWVTVKLEGGERAKLHLTRIPPRGMRLQSAVGVLRVGDQVRVTVAEFNERRGMIGVNLDAKLEGDDEISPEQLMERLGPG
jgi:ribosomal protein S1